MLVALPDAIGDAGSSRGLAIRSTLTVDSLTSDASTSCVKVTTMRGGGALTISWSSGTVPCTSKELAAADGILGAPLVIHWLIAAIVACGSGVSPSGIC